MDSLEALLNEHLPNCPIRDLIPRSSFKTITTPEGEILIFIRAIDMKLDDYYSTISAQTFGPEPIQQADFLSIQRQLNAMKGPLKCLYIIHSTVSGGYYLGCTVIHDKLALNWLQGRR